MWLLSSPTWAAYFGCHDIYIYCTLQIQGPEYRRWDKDGEILKGRCQGTWGSDNWKERNLGKVWQERNWCGCLESSSRKRRETACVRWAECMGENHRRDIWASWDVSQRLPLPVLHNQAHWNHHCAPGQEILGIKHISFASLEAYLGKRNVASAQQPDWCYTQLCCPSSKEPRGAQRGGSREAGPSSEEKRPKNWTQQDISWVLNQKAAEWGKI